MSHKKWQRKGAALVIKTAKKGLLHKILLFGYNYDV